MSHALLSMTQLQPELQARMAQAKHTPTVIVVSNVARQAGLAQLASMHKLNAPTLTYGRLARTREGFSLPQPRALARGNRCTVFAARKEKTEIVFQPFQEVQGTLSTVQNLDNVQQSLARLDYDPECEAAINEQINIEYNISYVYHALHAFFDRDNIGMPGLAKYFKEGSDEEREHAQLLITFQNIRGGRVKLTGIVSPEMEFNHPEKGDALHAMELALSLEKLNFSKLRLLHDIACKHDDAQMADFIEGYFLQEQARAVKEAAVYVSMLRRVGKGHGTWHFDRYIRDGTPVPEFGPPGATAAVA